MKVLAVIISYNFEPWMDRCLGSLSESEFLIDTLVIDNNSSDNTVQRLQSEYPHIRLIANQANLGFGRANNIGMQIALKEGYEAVFLMNQDAWVAKETIGTLIGLCKKHPEYGILSPVHLTASKQKLDPGFSSYSQIKEISQLPLHKEVVPLDFINAAFWMIPSCILKQIGGFSPLFYHYGEDKDFINRLFYHGYQVGYAPNASGCHDREYRPMNYAKFLHTEYVYHLSEYANINYSFAKAFCLGALATLKKSLQELFTGHTRHSYDYLSLTFRLLAQTKKVLYCRKRNIHPLLNQIFEP